jgi:hypothetical protein
MIDAILILIILMLILLVIASDQSTPERQAPRVKVSCCTRKRRSRICWPRWRKREVAQIPRGVGVKRGPWSRRHVLPILSIRGVYIQRNQVGLMIDAAACIVGDKPGEAQITFV